MSRTFAPHTLEGKVAFVVGGTRGFNLAIAKRYAEHGASVVVASRDPARCASAQAELQALCGGAALGLPLDVRDEARVTQAMQQAADAFGGLDIVVAGQAGNFYAPVLGMSANGFRSVVEIDLIGTFNVLRASYPHLRRPGATLIAITAPEGVKPLPFQSHVCAAKAAVNMFLKCLAIEWGPAGVRVVGLSPGPIAGSFGMEQVIATDLAVQERIRQAVPLRRWGLFDDVADAALFLASDAASYITGTILEVDGGVTINGGDSQDSATHFADNPRVKGRGRGDR